MSAGKDTVPKRHRSLSVRLAIMACGMFGFGYALVPLYYALCAITGVGATVGQAAAAPASMTVDLSRTVTVEFVAVSNESAPWEFRPDVTSVELHPGEVYAANFFARNLTDRRIVGQAVPSITPGEGSKHLHKLECFCFREQAFAPNEARELPVRFYLDPQLPSYVDRVTLSYTMFDKHVAAKTGPGSST